MVGYCIVLEKYQLISLLDEVLNQTSRKRKGGNELVYFCPKCRHYKRKLEVCIDETNKFFGVFHCWTCGTSGNLYALMEFTPSPSLCKSRLSVLLKGIKVVRGSEKFYKASSIISLPNEFWPLITPRKSPEYRNAMAYLKKRGVTEIDIVRYNIGYCESVGEYENYIIIPSYNSEGVLNFFMGRCYYDTPKYFPHKKPDVPMDNVVGFEIFVNYNEPLNLCEGVFDAIAIRNNAIPLFGKYPSRQLREKMIINGTKRVNLVLDSDALSDAVKNYKLLRDDVPNVEVHIVKLNGKDPSSLGFENVSSLIHTSTEFDFADLLRYRLVL